MKKKILISLFFIILLIGCTLKPSTENSELWEEVQRNYNGQIFNINKDNSYLKYLDGELIFIEKKDNPSGFKYSSIYFVKNGDYYYYSTNKLKKDYNSNKYQGKIKIEKDNNKLIINCEENNFIKYYEKIEDQTIIDKFN